jgi:hypothetical protein
MPSVTKSGKSSHVLFAPGPKHLLDHRDRGLAVDFENDRSVGFRDRVITPGRLAAVHDDRVHANRAAHQQRRCGLLHDLVLEELIRRVELQIPEHADAGDRGPRPD